MVFFSIMTSKTSQFPASVSSEIIRTGPADYDFLSMDTVINFRVVHDARLSDIVTQPQFAVRGSLTPDHLERANGILRASVTIVEEILGRVVV